MPPNTEFERFVWYLVGQITDIYSKVTEEISKAVKAERERAAAQSQADANMQTDANTKAEPDYRHADDTAEQVRVTDRRRFFTDEAETSAETAAPEASTAPNLKPKYVEELEIRTRDAEAKVADVQNRFEQVRARLKQETDELRARLQRTADERVTTEKAAFIASLLPVLDNLTLAIKAADDTGDVEKLMGGLHGTLSGFENAIAASGAEPIPSIGEHFDPEIHEAVDTVDTVEADDDGIITAEYSRGFRFGNRLLRPARVQVGRRKD